MDLIIQPRDGLTPLIAAIKKATKQIDITIFRFDLKELQRALQSAVTRGVKVHALIAHTTGGGQKQLRRLELEMLNAGVTVSRTDDDLLRYHYKMLLIDLIRSTPRRSTTRGLTSRRAAPWRSGPRTRRLSPRR